MAVLRAAGCVFAEDEAALLTRAAPDPTQLAALVARRVAGEPIEHVLGWAQFAGLRVGVASGVFVPRRRTEFLARRAWESAPDRPVVLDLCCGSGALGLAVATACRDAELHAGDCDPAAVACARQNLAAVGGQAHLGDLFAALPHTLRGRVDVLLANVPYVPTEAIAFLPAEAREHEPRCALDGGADGLDVLRRVLADTREWLAPGGRLLSELSDSQAETAIALAEASGLSATVEADEDGDTAVLLARR